MQSNTVLPSPQTKLSTHHPPSPLPHTISSQRILCITGSSVKREKKWESTEFVPSFPLVDPAEQTPVWQEIILGWRDGCKLYKSLCWSNRYRPCHSLSLFFFFHLQSDIDLFPMQGKQLYMLNSLSRITCRLCASIQEQETIRKHFLTLHIFSHYWFYRDAGAFPSILGGTWPAVLQWNSCSCDHTPRLSVIVKGQWFIETLTHATKHDRLQSVHKQFWTINIQQKSIHLTFTRVP